MADEGSPGQTITSDDGTTWVEIASTANSDEAELIRGFLEAEDIPAQLEHADASILPANIGKLGDVRVYVPTDDEARPLELLRKREVENQNLHDATARRRAGP